MSDRSGKHRWCRVSSRSVGCEALTQETVGASSQKSSQAATRKHRQCSNLGPPIPNEAQQHATLPRHEAPSTTQKSEDERHRATAATIRQVFRLSFQLALCIFSRPSMPNYANLKLAKMSCSCYCRTCSNPNPESTFVSTSHVIFSIKHMEAICKPANTERELLVNSLVFYVSWSQTPCRLDAGTVGAGLRPIRSCRVQ